MTWKEIKDAALQLTYSYSRGGILRPATKNDDYLRAMPFAANIALQELAYICPIRQSVLIKQYEETNTLDTTVEGEDGSTTFYAEDARSFYIEIQGRANVIAYQYEGDAYVLKSNTAVNNTVYAPYRYLYDLRGIAMVIIEKPDEYSDYDLRIRNYAFYSKYFPVNEIPSPGDTREYSIATLITDQGKLPYMMLAERPLQMDGYAYNDCMLFDGVDKLVLPGAMYGEIYLHYFAYPTLITADTLDAHVIELPREAVLAVPYYIAYAIMSEDDIQQSTMYYNRYEEMKARIVPKLDNYRPDEFISKSGW